MLSSRTVIVFLAVAALIVAAVFVTTSMINLVRPDVEQPMAASNAQGLTQYQQSERALYPGYNTEVGLTQYHKSERAGQSFEMGLAQYYRSERGLSEGTMAVSNDLGWAQYHRSEWFGK